MHTAFPARWWDNTITFKELESTPPVLVSSLPWTRPARAFWLGYKLEGKEKKKRHVIGVTRRCFTLFSWVAPFHLVSHSVPAQLLNFLRYIFYFLLFLFAKQSLRASKMATRNTSSAGALEVCGSAHRRAIGRRSTARIFYWTRGAVDSWRCLTASVHSEWWLAYMKRLKVYRDVLKTFPTYFDVLSWVDNIVF